MSDQPQGSGFSTLALHAGLSRTDAPAKLLAHGSYAAATYDPLARTSLNGRSDSTCALLEERVAALEGGSAAVAMASGRAARLAAFQMLLQPGDEIVAARQDDGSLNHGFASFGWQVRLADPAVPASFVDALSDRTKAIFIESMAEADGTITDIEAVAAIARRARVPLVVDNFTATPYLTRPFEHGADIVLHTSMVRLAGTEGATGGLIVDGGSFDWIGDARYPQLSRPAPGYDGTIIGETFGNFAFAAGCRMLGLRHLGATLSGTDAEGVLAGLATLALRVQRQCDSALAVARHLARHPAVEHVGYAGLDGDAHAPLARRYCPNGAGAILRLDLVGGADTRVALLDRVRLFSRTPDAAGARSCVIPPAGDEATGSLLLAIGLEDARDIIADLDRALGS